MAHRAAADADAKPSARVLGDPAGDTVVVQTLKHVLGLLRAPSRGRSPDPSGDGGSEAHAAMLEATLDNMDQGLIMVDAAGFIKVCNHRAIELLDLPADLMATYPRFSDVVRVQNERGDFRKADDRMRRWFETANIELTQHAYERETPGGRVLEVRSTQAPDGGMVRTYTDITERRRAEAARLLAETDYRSLFENAELGIYRSTMDGVLLRANPALARLNGFDSEAEMLAATSDVRSWYVDPTRRDAFMSELRSKGRVTDFLSEVIRGSHLERAWVSETAWIVTGPDGTDSLEGTVVDATERKSAEAKIEYLAQHDPLTGLPNRTLFHERLEADLREARRTGRPIAILCLDLDRFKTVNDSLGHMAGDTVLEIVSQRLSRIMAPSDLAARLGGDEFVVICNGARDRSGVAELAGRIIQSVGQPMPVAGRHLTVGASIGIAHGPADSLDAGQLLKSADLALYRAKTGGRSAFRFYEPDMDVAAEERHNLELDLRGALARNEFEVHYQPQVNLGTGEITGLEALVRWRHPVRGLVSPAEFIQVAEETGFIVPLGAWVLRQACLDATSWPERFRVAVNISPIQFRFSDVAADALDAIKAAGLSPERLELEITESVLMDDCQAASASEALHRLRSLGLGIALDDFGTGFSSLNYLRKFPFDTIKIDREFIRDLLLADGSLVIVRAIIGIGRDLGVTVTAEGVETLDQLDRLRLEGCHEVQGYFLGRPMPAAGIAPFASEWRQRRLSQAAFRCTEKLSKHD